MYQRIQKSSSNTPTQDQSSKSSQHSLTIQAQQTSPESFTQEEIENEAFNQSKFEASRLQLKKDGGIITPVEQERLDVLQAKMDDFWIQRRAKGSQFSYSLESILGPVPENPLSKDVQLKLAIQPHISDVSPRSPKNRGTDFQRGDAQNYQIPSLQTKLTIGQPHDKYEQEADRVALQVVQQINSPANTKSIQEQSVKRHTEEEEIQAKPEITSILRQGASTQEKASTELESAINSARGSGQPLAPNLQQSMGQAMKVDFSGVRVHTDAKSDQLNQSIQARAFTTGQDVFFRQGEYQPGSRSGQELIAHELTHVVQQNGALQYPKVLSREIIQRDPTKNGYITVEKNSEEDKEYRDLGKDIVAARRLIDTIVPWITAKKNPQALKATVINLVLIGLKIGEHFIAAPGLSQTIIDTVAKDAVNLGVGTIKNKTSLPEQSTLDRMRETTTFGGKVKQTIHDKVGTPKNIGKTLLSLTGIKLLNDLRKSVTQLTLTSADEWNQSKGLIVPQIEQFMNMMDETLEMIPEEIQTQVRTTTLRRSALLGTQTRTLKVIISNYEKSSGTLRVAIDEWRRKHQESEALLGSTTTSDKFTGELPADWDLYQIKSLYEKEIKSLYEEQIEPLDDLGQIEPQGKIKRTDQKLKKPGFFSKLFTMNPKK